MATGQLMGQSFITEARLNEILKNYATNQTLNSYLAKSGGTMTGDLILNRDPVNDMQAVNKRYVDTVPDNTLKLITHKHIVDTYDDSKSGYEILRLNRSDKYVTLYFFMSGSLTASKPDLGGNSGQQLYARLLTGKPNINTPILALNAPYQQSSVATNTPLCAVFNRNAFSETQSFVQPGSTLEISPNYPVKLAFRGTSSDAKIDVNVWVYEKTYTLSN